MSFKLTGARRLARASIMALAFLNATIAGPLMATPNPKPVLAAVVSVEIAPEWQSQGKAFEGWGTALAWFANVTGKLPDAQRQRLADLLYGSDGLRFNITRYNIGGGNAPETAPYLRPGADIQGFWRRPATALGTDWWQPDDEAMWDWSADAGQRWWLDAIRDRVPVRDQIFEAFSNSPPYFMTLSGRVSGHADGLVDNLRPGEEKRFAAYLVRTTQTLERLHRIRFRTLSPVNEPNTPYWYAANTQEGAHWSPEAQSAILKAVYAELKARDSSTVIAGMDETNAQTFVQDWLGIDDEARATIDQLNVHSYDTTGKTAARDIARASGKRLWMSEVDLSPPNVPQTFEDIRPAIALGEQIISDIHRMEPQAWVLWQAIENETKAPDRGSNWGLIKMDYANTVNPEVHVTAKYGAMANFSRYIRPGDRFVPVDDPDTVVAIKPDGKSFVIVHVNPGGYTRKLNVVAPRGKRRYVVETIVTDQVRQSLRLADMEGLSSLVARPMSVTTFVVTAK